MKSRSFIIFLTGIFIFLLYSPHAFAQTDGTLSGANDFYISNDTPHPQKGNAIELEAKSYVYDMDTMYLKWTINNQVIKEGMGEKFIETIFNGLPILVIVSIIDIESKKTITQSMTISNEELIVLSQVEDAFVPPFYKGKALPGPESTITYAVMPKNLLESAEYGWTFDFEKDLRNSGFNKSMITKSHSLLSRSTKINIEKRQVGIQKGFITFDQTFNDGKLVWYPFTNSLLDIWNGATNSITIDKSPVKLQNITFNLSGKDQNILDYSYILDNIKIPEKTKDKDILIFETNGKQGKSILKTNIEHPELVGQFTENILQISY